MKIFNLSFSQSVPPKLFNFFKDLNTFIRSLSIISYNRSNNIQWKSIFIPKEETDIPELTEPLEFKDAIAMDILQELWTEQDQGDLSYFEYLDSDDPRKIIDTGFRPVSK